jgi:hypothetical protein
VAGFRSQVSGIRGIPAVSRNMKTAEWRGWLIGDTRCAAARRGIHPEFPPDCGRWKEPAAVKEQSHEKYLRTRPDLVRTV